MLAQNFYRSVVKKTNGELVQADVLLAKLMLKFRK